MNREESKVMNNLLLDIANMLKEKMKVQEGKADYNIIEIKTYYNLEHEFKIAMKIYDKVEQKEKIVLLGEISLEGLENYMSKEKWFESLV
jgi:hypothetical protein